MNEKIKKRVLKEAEYIIKTNETIRNTGKYFNISKSTVYIDVTSRLKKMNTQLFIIVNNIIQEHKNTRHIKGGASTRKKFKRI